MYVVRIFPRIVVQVSYLVVLGEHFLIFWFASTRGSCSRRLEKNSSRLSTRGCTRSLDWAVGGCPYTHAARSVHRKRRTSKRTHVKRGPLKKKACLIVISVGPRLANFLDWYVYVRVYQTHGHYCSNYVQQFPKIKHTHDKRCQP